MLKYYKEFLSQYEYASLLQTLILIGFMAIFITVFVKVMKKPKDFYKDNESAALDLEPEENEKNNTK
ncbi:cbb3-type cytochrome c oxidase subunit 3 [Empedobacter stercoris]|uniref:cbb3-type cytochrome c oxidase subunit 3 n=1 Tax=Empedobacter stercoris TaxID=1628248 RepID=UPI001CE03185|nr:cbb3-type cytochrome c oxidase subunit 3 [Empedobacter stercoris]MCA4783012.1 cbb3-type cytochrome c oxidase subunit 3 [Empedobacter stercoris]HJD87683.1 cbb3-type cytochrome c oxidase subunit 3 [Empedobacter falsenii]